MHGFIEVLTGRAGRISGWHLAGELRCQKMYILLVTAGARSNDRC
jgi:hypothetical protein